MRRAHDSGIRESTGRPNREVRPARVAALTSGYWPVSSSPVSPMPELVAPPVELEPPVLVPIVLLPRPPDMPASVSPDWAASEDAASDVHSEPDEPPLIPDEPVPDEPPSRAPVPVGEPPPIPPDELLPMPPPAPRALRPRLRSLQTRCRPRGCPRGGGHLR